MVDDDWCISILALVVGDWRISFLVVQITHCSLAGSLWIMGILTSVISIPLPLLLLLRQGEVL